MLPVEIVCQCKDTPKLWLMVGIVDKRQGEEQGWKLLDLAGLSEQLRKEGLTEKETCEQRTQTGERKWVIWVSQGKAVTAGKAAGMEDQRLMCEGGRR